MVKQKKKIAEQHLEVEAYEKRKINEKKE